MFTRRSGSTVLGSAFLATWLLTSCGGSDDPSATPSSGDSSDSSASSSPSASSSSTGGASTGADPATGPQVSTTWFSVRFPTGFRLGTAVEDISYSAQDPKSREVNLVGVDIADTYGVATTLDDSVASNIRSSNWPRKPERLADTTIDGETAYHLSGVSGLGEAELDVFGVLHDGQDVALEFDLNGTADERQAVIDSVLATWRWK